MSASTKIPYMVIKKDGRAAERFERQKILQGLLKACEKAARAYAEARSDCG